MLYYWRNILKDRDYLKTYRIYIALKQHFNTENNFVYTSPDALSRLGIDSLLKRKDRRFFIALTRKLHPDQYEYLLSMFVKDKNMWVGEMLERTNKEYHSQRMGRLNQLEYVVRSEIDELLMLNDGCLRDMLDANNNIPLIAKNNKVSMETKAIINKIINYTSEETLNPLWNDMRFTIDNYSKLLYISPALSEVLLELDTM